MSTFRKDMSQAVALAASGKTRAQVAAALGVSERTLWTFSRLHDVVFQPTPRPPQNEKNAPSVYLCSRAEALALNDGKKLCERKSKAGAYRCQRKHAARRGIAWEISFPEWVSIWESSGRWAQRGIGLHGYCMARNGDVGPYKVGNVSVQSAQQNSRDGVKKALASMRRNGPPLLGSGRGWTFISRHKNTKPYQVVVSKTYVGTFASQGEAEAAYRAAVALRKDRFHGVGG